MFQGALYVFCEQVVRVSRVRCTCCEVTLCLFQGALYVLLGENKQCLMTKRNWSVMQRVWPALISSRHSEKPSIIKLLDTIINKLHKHIETTEINITVSAAALTVPVYLHANKFIGQTVNLLEALRNLAVVSLAGARRADAGVRVVVGRRHAPAADT